MKPEYDEEQGSCYTCQMCATCEHYGEGEVDTPADIEDFVKLSGKKEPLWRRSVRLCWHVLTLRWLKITTRKSVDKENGS